MTIIMFLTSFCIQFIKQNLQAKNVLKTTDVNKYSLMVLHWPSIPPNWPTQLLLAGADKAVNLLIIPLNSPGKAYPDINSVIMVFSISFNSIFEGKGDASDVR